MTVPAVHVHFGADKIAGLYCLDFLADAFHNAAKFVTQRDRRLDASLRPAIPAINVQVRAADRGSLDPHKHVGWSNRRHRHRFDRESFRCVRFPQRFHGGRHAGWLLTRAGWTSYTQEFNASTSAGGTSARRSSALKATRRLLYAQWDVGTQPSAIKTHPTER